MNEYILVVDREPEWREFVAEQLRDAGYSVSIQLDTASTFREVERRFPDLILADASLSDLVDRLAIDYRSLRFIVFTVSPSVQEALRAFRRGALDYEGKAFDTLALLRVVQVALDSAPVCSPRILSDGSVQYVH